MLAFVGFLSVCFPGGHHSLPKSCGRNAMRLMVINPNTSVEMTDSIDNVAKKYARPDTEMVSW